jgi:folate-dependent phosphoribosylglycinamide formyltransferase PurN
MKSNNPYINTLVEMGYDRADCEMVAAAGREKTFPCVIHGRTFESQDQYDDELAEYLNGL